MKSLESICYRTKLLAGVCGLVLATGVVVTWLADRGALAGTGIPNISR